MTHENRINRLVAADEKSEAKPWRDLDKQESNLSMMLRR